LDNATENLNEGWSAQEGEIKRQIDEMESALTFTRDVFGEKNYLRKWNGTEFESRKNRAVFDIMLHYFSVPEVREKLSGQNETIVAKFQELCVDSAMFKSSLETTTKSAASNRHRFNIWGDAVQELSGVDVTGMKFPV
jgi:hypothetical protein